MQVRLSKTRENTDKVVDLQVKSAQLLVETGQQERTLTLLSDILSSKSLQAK